MADIITDLTDDDMRTEWPPRRETMSADDDATDPGGSPGADDDATDPGGSPGADDDATDPGGSPDADDDASDA